MFQDIWYMMYGLWCMIFRRWTWRLRWWWWWWWSWSWSWLLLLLWWWRWWWWWWTWWWWWWCWWWWWWRWWWWWWWKWWWWWWWWWWLCWWWPFCWTDQHGWHLVNWDPNQIPNFPDVAAHPYLWRRFGNWMVPGRIRFARSQRRW